MHGVNFDFCVYEFFSEASLLGTMNSIKIIDEQCTAMNFGNSVYTYCLDYIIG